MSVIGSPIETSLLQAAQAQQSASKARDKDRARSDAARRFADLVDLRVSGVEDVDSIKRLPKNESELAQDEQRRQDDTERPRIDLKA